MVIHFVKWALLWVLKKHENTREALVFHVSEVLKIPNGGSHDFVAIPDEL